jgi:orotate phosphoribosyltransferase
MYFTEVWLMESYRKITSKKYSNIVLRVIPGHFVTANSHINYYIDMSLMKARRSEADAVASAFADQYIATTVVDTIFVLTAVMSSAHTSQTI